MTTLQDSSFAAKVTRAGKHMFLIGVAELAIYSVMKGDMAMTRPRPLPEFLQGINPITAYVASALLLISVALFYLNRVRPATNNKEYVGVGLAEGAEHEDYWEYDPEMNSWTRKADCGGPGSWGFTIGDKGYSGEDGTGFWEYDPSANQWTRKADTRSFFDQIAAFSIGDKGYVGSNGSYYQYIPEANVWREVDGPTTRQGFANAVVINGKAYVLRGNKMWEFTPPE